VRWRRACSLLRRHAQHDSAASDCTSEHGENYFDFPLMTDVAILQQSFTTRVPFVDNCTVSKPRMKSHTDGVQSHPSWRGLRLANMPMRLGMVLLAVLLGGFLAILLHNGLQLPQIVTLHISIEVREQ
jgi:hypothetical protein